MLDVQNVCKDYRMGRQELRVLHDVSLSVRRGEFLGIEGPSGAGKSTLLHLIGILDTPTRGKIIHDSINLPGLNSGQQAYWRNQLFGFVFQFFHLLPDFTACENVALPALANLGTFQWFTHKRTTLNRARELLKMVGLADRADHRPGQLSGGERQRVAIARALINEPEVLLCDEPTGNMDTQTGSTILNLLCDLQENTGVTLIIVTHDPQVADRAQRNIHMVDGRIVDDVE